MLTRVCKKRKKTSIADPINKMARVAGFEPANDGVRVHCLTAWRHPYSVLRSEHDTYFSFFYRICQENISNFSQKYFAGIKAPPAHMLRSE